MRTKGFKKLLAVIISLMMILPVIPVVTVSALTKTDWTVAEAKAEISANVPLQVSTEGGVTANDYDKSYALWYHLNYVILELEYPDQVVKSVRILDDGLYAGQWGIYFESGEEQVLYQNHVEFYDLNVRNAVDAIKAQPFDVDFFGYNTGSVNAPEYYNWRDAAIKAEAEHIIEDAIGPNNLFVSITHLPGAVPPYYAIGISGGDDFNTQPLEWADVPESDINLFDSLYNEITGKLANTDIKIEGGVTADPADKDLAIQNYLVAGNGLGIDIRGYKVKGQYDANGNATAFSLMTDIGDYSKPWDYFSVTITFSDLEISAAIKKLNDASPIHIDFLGAYNTAANGPVTDYSTWKEAAMIKAIEEITNSSSYYDIWFNPVVSGVNEYFVYIGLGGSPWKEPYDATKLIEFEFTDELYDDVNEKIIVPDKIHEVFVNGGYYGDTADKAAALNDYLSNTMDINLKDYTVSFYENIFVDTTANGSSIYWYYVRITDKNDNNEPWCDFPMKIVFRDPVIADAIETIPEKLTVVVKNGNLAGDTAKEKAIIATIEDIINNKDITVWINYGNSFAWIYMSTAGVGGFPQEYVYAKIEYHDLDLTVLAKAVNALNGKISVKLPYGSDNAIIKAAIEAKANEILEAADINVDGVTAEKVNGNWVVTVNKGTLSLRSIPVEVNIEEPDPVCECDICGDCGKCLDALAGDCDCADCPGACDCTEPILCECDICGDCGKCLDALAGDCDCADCPGACDCDPEDDIQIIIGDDVGEFKKVGGKDFIIIDADDIADLMDKFDGYDIEVINAATGDDTIGTGAVIKLLKNGVLVDEITVVVTNDVNGDGEFDFDDFIDIINAYNGVNPLDSDASYLAIGSTDNTISFDNFIDVLNAYYA